MSNLQFNMEALPNEISFLNTPVVADQKNELTFSSRIQPFSIHLTKCTENNDSPQYPLTPVHLTESEPFFTDRQAETERSLTKKFFFLKSSRHQDNAKVFPIPSTTSEVISSQVDQEDPEIEEEGESNPKIEEEAASPAESDGLNRTNRVTRPAFQREDFFRRKKHKHTPRQEFVEHILEHRITRIILTVFTVFALFNASIGSLVGTIIVDEIFDIISLVSFVVFVLEFLAALYVEEGYAWSLYFYFDILATFSVFLHIEFLLEDFFPEMVAHSSEMLEASRAIRLFTGHGALIQLTQLLQVGKVYKQAKKSERIQELEENLEGIRNYNAQLAKMGETTSQTEVETPSPRRRGKSATVAPMGNLQNMRRTSTMRHGGQGHHMTVSMEIEEEKDHISQEIRRKALKNAEVYRNKNMKTMKTFVETTFPDVQAAHIKEMRIAKRKAFSTLKMVIVISLVLLMILPLFYADFYYYLIDGQEYDMGLLAKIIDDDTVQDSTKEKLIRSFIDIERDSEPRLVYFSVGKEVLLAESHLNYDHLRHSDYNTVAVSTKNRGLLKSIVSMRNHNRLKALLSLGNIIFICIALILSTLFLLKDTNELLMEPFDKIIRHVNHIVRDPLNIKKYRFRTDQIHKDFLHTALRLEEALIRMVKLLVLGFGESGAAVIVENIEITGTLDPAIRGDKRAAIFAVCNIKHFAKLTDALQEDVMLFVNSVADIVHSMTDKFHGAASQNMGDSFLLVWKFDEENIKRERDGRITVIKNRITENIADCALICALKTCTRIGRDPGLMKFSQYLGNNDKIEVGFGLHVGWAFEGAIGTEYKIDATYISSNVNVAIELEAGTGHYKVPILFSGEFYETLSEQMQEKCREIDLILVNKSPNALTVYTVDFEVERMLLSKERDLSPRRAPPKKQKKKKACIKHIIEQEYAYTMLETDKELVHIMRNPFREWRKWWDEGFEAYREGHWRMAKEKFEECLAIKEKETDQPTHNLLNYMRRHKFMAPAGWKYREMSFR